ncbi:MAG TPA: hypothetical protein VGB48_00280 [Allosphingosinicella sp.]|jgi:hypothetical protein
MAESTVEWLRAFAFLLVLLPALVANLRSGLVTNAHNAMIFLVGVAILVTERLLSEPSMSLPWGLWTTVILLVIVLASLGTVPGGVAKLLIALLPWFTGWESYLFTATAGFFFSAAWGYAKGGQAPLIPAFYLAGLGAFIYAAA